MSLQTQLSKDFNTGEYTTGASKLKQGLWYLTDIFFFKSKIIPSSNFLVSILRTFGAKIGKDVRIKPGIHVKFPWRLTVGDYSWLADCYLDNLAEITIGKNCCISQQAMLVTGNHNYNKTSFDLITRSITLEDGVWIGAGAMVCPGVLAESHSVLSMGSVANTNLKSFKVYQGNPAVPIRDRNIK